MRRWATTLVGIAIVALAAWLVARRARAPKTEAGSLVHPVADGGDGLLSAYGGAGPVPSTPSSPLAPGRNADSGGGAGDTMFDGAPVPPLPSTVPRELRFGVVLVSYAGAQPGANGDPPSRRSRGEARELAIKLATLARHDFHAAVQQGDGGSADDIGTVKLGMLEPAPEYVLFTLPIGAVGGPVDTPRGYWVVKRLE